jgi:dihydrofolate synthase/folylpolyglutamate synthase
MAVATCELLNKQGWQIKKESIKEGLKRVHWPGRIEVIKNGPLIVLDGAHNSTSAKALKNTIKEYFNYQNLILVFSCCKDKNVNSVAREIFPLAKEVILTKIKFIRAAEPEDIAKKTKEFQQRVVIEKDLTKALKYAVKTSRHEDLICITGSLYLVGEARKILKLHGGGLCLKE